MLVKDIKTGTKLKLEVYDENNQKIEKTFISQFECSEGNNYIIIHMPLHEGSVYPIHIDNFMHVLFSEGDRLYCISTKVVDRYISNEIHFLKAKVLGEIKNIQRRNDYRLKCNLPIIFKRIKFDGLAFKPIDDQFITSRIMDISGGGVCILLNEEVEVNSHLQCVINLEYNCNVEFIGKILRIEKNEQSKNYTHIAGLVYDIIDSKHKEKIIKFIFKEQRNLRKKGII